MSLSPGEAFPKITLPHVDGSTAPLRPEGAGWHVVIVYRGLHCPLCKKYLSGLEDQLDDWTEIGVTVSAVSGDPKEKAEAFVEETGISIPVAYGLSVEQMAQLGLYVSDPRSPQETDRPFPEPAVFAINPHGTVQIMDLSNAPFARPDLGMLLNGIKFVRENDYPIRGRHAA